jgi:hypothetical protein
MAETGRLDSAKWRIYLEPNLDPARDPETGSIHKFDSLEEAQRWWASLHPGDSQVQEAIKCAHCDAYYMYVIRNSPSKHEFEAVVVEDGIVGLETA